MIVRTNGDKQAGIGLVGCGAIAEIYHLPALLKMPGLSSRLWLVEPNAKRLEAVRNKFPCAGGVADYKELDGKVSGVIVATPPSSHYTISKWFLERGVDVLCEKPLTENYQEARELVQLAETHNAKLAVNQTRRFFPTYKKIRELIASGVLGNCVPFVITMALNSIGLLPRLTILPREQRELGPIRVFICLTPCVIG